MNIFVFFANFLADMGEKPAKHELDRIDNNKGYDPTNCRWVETKINANNRENNHSITFRGKAQNIKQWAADLKCSHSALGYRLRSGWSVEEAFTTPFNHGNAWKRGTRKCV